MTTMQEILLHIQSNNPVYEAIPDLINNHAARSLIMQELYTEYQGEVPITNRVMEDETKSNNKLVNDYRGDIIDTITGYLFGIPLTYAIDDKRFQMGDTVSPTFEVLRDEFETFRYRNNIEDTDGEIGKMMSICGYGARLIYINTDGLESVINVNPWECIFIYDGTNNELQYAIRYYKIHVKIDGIMKERYKVEWYDNQYVETYMQVDEKTYDLIESRPHLFDYVPLIEFPNNQERQGDFEKVSSLIDAYDLTASDAQNEIEEFRMAYLVFHGLVPDAATIKKARQSGAFGLMDPEMNISFLTKQISDTLIENHKKTLNENIYKFAKTVDMSAENFSGAGMSGEARKWKLLGLENKAISKERKYTGALKHQFRVLASAWKKKGIDVDYTDIYWEFKRNLPVEMKLEAETTGLLKGLVSEETRLGLLAFIDDPMWEIEKMQRESEVRLSMFEDDNDDTEDDGNTGDEDV